MLTNSTKATELPRTKRTTFQAILAKRIVLFVADPSLSEDESPVAADTINYRKK